MKEISKIHFEQTEISFFILRTSRRTTTISITVNSRGQVILKSPLKTPLTRLQEIALKRGSWIVERLKMHEENTMAGVTPDVLAGEALFFLGRKYPVHVAIDAHRRAGTVCNHTDEGFYVTLPAGAQNPKARAVLFHKAVKTWFVHQAKRLLSEKTTAFAKRMRLKPGEIRIRDMRWLWGSCDNHCNLTYNWKILMTDETVIDYLIVHELSHIEVRNHPPEFWNLMESVLPGTQDLRQELRRCGVFLNLDWYHPTKRS